MYGLNQDIANEYNIGNNIITGDFNLHIDQVIDFYIDHNYNGQYFYIDHYSQYIKSSIQDITWSTYSLYNRLFYIISCVDAYAVI